MEIEKWLNGNQLSIDIWKKKYQFENEDFSSWLTRVSGGDPDVRKLIEEKKFLFGGRTLANRGLDNEKNKATLANCYVVPVNDNLESIFKCNGEIARTYSYGGGCGICLSNLCPAGMKVNNAAKTSSGALSFASIFDLTTATIGQLSRRGALMLALSSEHPDLEEFISIKSDLNKLTHANLSVMASDAFMNAVVNKENYELKFMRNDTGESFSKIINADEVFDKLVYNNYTSAEPGLLYWSKMTNWSMICQDPTFKLESVNPCSELALPAYGACCLGSINLIAYIKDNSFDFESFKYDIPIIVKAMNSVLNEGLPLHPLKEQREAVAKYRQIGIGVMSWASCLMKLGIRYGSDDSIKLASKIAKTLLNESVKASTLLAKDEGTYPAYNYDYIIKSKFYQENLDEETKTLVASYGLRNSQLLSIAPTGTLSTLLGVSGGIEPLFATSYTRRTESLHGESVSYKVYDPTVLEIMKELNIADENDLPDYVITSQEIPYMERIAMQAAWQQYIDASISSTINLPNSATVEDIKNIYIEAWKAGLKGVTVYRAGCAREGILTTGDSTPASASELKRGDWKPIAEDTIYPKIKLKTGCGELMLFPGWSDSEQTFQEIWIKKIGSGGCERSIEAIAIEASAIFRLGGSLYNIEKAFKKLETCPAFTNARKAGKRLSRGNSCADCILKALQKFEAEKKKESIELVNDSEEGTPASIESKNTCPDCGADLIATGGCVNCISCGYSKCS